jgi:hypothetical protein
MSEDEEDNDNAGEMGCYNEDDNHVDEEVTDSTLASSSFPGVTPGGARFLIAPTYAPPAGKTTGTKKAKAMLAAARASRKNPFHLLRLKFPLKLNLLQSLCLRRSSRLPGLQVPPKTS